MKLNLNSSLYKNIDAQALDLLKQMLKIDPKERIKASEILKHPYISSNESTSEKELLSPASTVCSSSRGINFA